MIVLRYMRKDGTLRFGDFVVVILNLTVAFGNFLKNGDILMKIVMKIGLGHFDRKDSMRNGVVKINMGEVKNV